MKSSRILQRSFPLWLLMLAIGCASGYSEFYRRISPKDFPPTDNVQVFGYSQEGVEAAKRDGYAVISVSHFNGPYAGEEAAISQAKDVGANIVFLDIKYTETRQGTLPLSQYHLPQTYPVRSYHSGDVDVYGAGGYAHGSYSGTTTSYYTTPGYTTTTYIPYSVDRYDHTAIFLRRVVARAPSGSPMTSSTPTPTTKANTTPALAPIVEARITPTPPPTRDTSITSKLRSQPTKLTEDDILAMLIKYDYYDSVRNRNGSSSNDFVEDTGLTVTDRVSNLMWQKNGSDLLVGWAQSKTYVHALNALRFAGYADWRIPTIEELASLVNSNLTEENIHIAPVFSSKQRLCGSSDTYDTGACWGIDFNRGWIVQWIVNQQAPVFYVRVVRSLQ